MGTCREAGNLYDHRKCKQAVTWQATLPVRELARAKELWTLQAVDWQPTKDEGICDLFQALKKITESAHCNQSHLRYFLLPRFMRLTACLGGTLSGMT